MDAGVQTAFGHGVRQRRQPDSYDGFVIVELAHEPIPYHISSTFQGLVEERECHALAVCACRVACLAVDVIRGKLASTILRRAVNSSVLDRLDRLAYLMDTRMNSDSAFKAVFRYPPVVPHWLSGMLISPTCLEMCAQISIGRQQMWSTLRLEQVGNRWVCTYADMG